jgi:hypothetical protein
MPDRLDSFGNIWQAWIFLILPDRHGFSSDERFITNALPGHHLSVHGNLGSYKKKRVTIDKQVRVIPYTVKKRLAIFPSPGGISLTKPSLTVLVSDIPAGDGKIPNLFLQCKMTNFCSIHCPTWNHPEDVPLVHHVHVYCLLTKTVANNKFNSVEVGCFASAQVVVPNSQQISCLDGSFPTREARVRSPAGTCRSRDL